jgi:spore germination cell wall hydrolase CwlJ-like protein
MLRKLIAAALSAALLAALPALAQTLTSEGSPAARNCLVAAAWIEARGRPAIEAEAVMHVIVNRSNHPAYGGTACDVVLAKGQFQMVPAVRSALRRVRDGTAPVTVMSKKHDDPEIARLIECAERVLEGGDDPTHGATHFYSPKLRIAMNLDRVPYWARRMPLTASLGEFRFHRLRS